MTKSIREVKESPLPQGIDERIAYTLTTTPWGSNPGTLKWTSTGQWQAEQDKARTTMAPFDKCL